MRGRFVCGYGILYGRIDVVTNNVHQSTLVVCMLINEWVNNEYLERCVKLKRGYKNKWLKKKDNEIKALKDLLKMVMPE